MKSSYFPTLLCLSLILCVSAAPRETLSAAEDRPPNIILLITDDQGYAPIAAHGHPWINTPNLDKLHDTSTRFTRFLVSPTCSPTRAALMTGRHPMKNGVTHTILERERMTLNATILPQVLKTAGYTSGIFGKWHLGDEEEYQPRNRGFDESFIHGAGGIGQAYDCSCADAPGNKYFDPAIRHNGKFVKTKGYCTDLFYTAALGWIKEITQGKKSAGAARTPFFAYITTNAPHGPFIAPPSNTKRFTDLGFEEKTAGFYGMIENIDENIGRLLTKLEEWDLMEDTIIIFMSDNGMTGGGSGRPGATLGNLPDGTPMEYYNAEQKGMKGSTDEGGVRVPFFVRWDGQWGPNREVDSIAAHIDVLPTLADIAGIDLKSAEGASGSSVTLVKQVEGRSLVPLLEAPDTDWPDRFLFTHKGRWATGSDPNEDQFKNFAVRNQRFRYVGATGGNKRQQDEPKAFLYDMEADPGQTTDVIDQYPEVAKKMLNAYKKFWKEAVPLMVNEDAPMSPTRPYHEDYYAQEKKEGIPNWQPPSL
ncbi:MAG: arylsulfatase [Verrucomicrobiota bacterium]